MVTRFGVLLTPFLVWLGRLCLPEREEELLFPTPTPLPVGTEHVASFWLTPLHFKAQ